MFLSCPNYEALSNLFQSLSNQFVPSSTNIRAHQISKSVLMIRMFGGVTNTFRFWRDCDYECMYHQGDLLMEGLVDPLLKNGERTRSSFKIF